MVVQPWLDVGHLAVATFRMTTASPATILGAPAITSQPLIAIAAVASLSPVPCFGALDHLALDVASCVTTATPFSTIAARRRTRSLSRGAPLLPFTVCSRELFGGPRSVEQILKLVERCRSHRAALSAVD